MIVHREYAQGSMEWMIAHCGIPTASEFDQIVTPEWKLRTGQMPATYLSKKVAEAWQGGPLPGFGSWQTDQGNILESEALPWYELEYGVAIDRVGFVTTEGGMIGCSPDGLFPVGGGIEIKCPNADTHTGYLLNGELPKDYAAQVHGCMFVCNAPHWKFLSYRRHFPALVLTIDRDEEIQEKLAEALAMFLAKFQSAMQRMEEINGGPSPASRPPTSFAETKRAARPPPEPVSAEYRD